MIYILTLWEDEFHLVRSQIYSNKKQAIKLGKEHEEQNALYEDAPEGNTITTFSYHIQEKVTPRNKKEWMYVANTCLDNHTEM
tara:strand:+ start:30 stop:278 length:249 start_codon:yes stop_codon:yes gene_type:complete